MKFKGAVQCLQEKPYKFNLTSLLQLLYNHIRQWFVVVIISCNTKYFVASKHHTHPLSFEKSLAVSFVKAVLLIQPNIEWYATGVHVRPLYFLICI